MVNFAAASQMLSMYLCSLRTLSYKQCCQFKRYLVWLWEARPSQILQNPCCPTSFLPWLLVQKRKFRLFCFGSEINDLQWLYFFFLFWVLMGFPVDLWIMNAIPNPEQRHMAYAFKNCSCIRCLGNENHDSTKKTPVCPLKISHFHELYNIWIKHI